MGIFSLISAVFITSVCVISMDRLGQQFFINLAFTAFPLPKALATSRNSSILEFPNDFIFGVSSSAFQIEGGWNEDGKSASIWDTFTHQHSERVVDGSFADIGPNSYHLFEDDLNAVEFVGFQHYRFSISWTRVMPNGATVNQKGIDYYAKIIDELIARGIEPVVTIYHWDLPQFLQDLGGLTNPIFVDYFVAYADVLFKAFGDKVKWWITLNEPWPSCIMSYEIGMYAPGIKSPGVGTYLCVHHLLLAHSATYHLYRKKYAKKFNGKIGIALEAIYLYPNDSSVTPEDHHRAMQYRVGWFANPIFGSGDYPQVMVNEIGARSSIEGRAFSRLPKFLDEMKQSIRGSADFFGLNYYTSAFFTVDEAEKDPHDAPSWFSDWACKQTTDPSWKRGKNAWLFSVPDGLRSLLNWIKHEYKNPPLIITENGWSDDGEMEDDDRIEYFNSHLKAVAKAINIDKCNVIGYTAWSLLDSYEWNTGFTVAYGIFNVNYTSPMRERTPKKSAKYWQSFLKKRTLAND